jgi:hypothetical protein
MGRIDRKQRTLVGRRPLGEASILSILPIL